MERSWVTAVWTRTILILSGRVRERERERERESNLMFYAQSTFAVISGRKRGRQTGRQADRQAGSQADRQS